MSCWSSGRASSASSSPAGIRCAPALPPGTPRCAPGKESLEVDLKRDPAPALELVREADVVLESFRPGVASRLGIGPEHVPERTVYCSITGFGLGGRHEQRAGHDLNYLGWAGALWDTAPALPPVQIADLAAGGLSAVTRILAALLERDRTGTGGHLVVSMTHGSHRLVAHRLGGETVPRMLTGGLACYRIYETADGRHLTVGALEPDFFRRLTELLGRPELAERQFDTDQEALATELAATLRDPPAGRVAGASSTPKTSASGRSPRSPKQRPTSRSCSGSRRD